MFNRNDVQVGMSGSSGARPPLFVVVGFCVLSGILLSVASVIVLSLIPVYLSSRGVPSVNHLHSTTPITTITTPITTITTPITTITTPITTITTPITTTTLPSGSVVGSDNDRFYVFDFLNANTSVSTGGGGRIVSATAANFPALIDSAIAMTVGYISACGISLPHTHPRANELLFIISGQFETGIFQETDARFIMNTINTGQGTVFPLASIHFEQNLSCEPAIYVAAFDSEDPGEQTLANVLFMNMPADVLQANIPALNTTISLNDLKSLLPNDPALGIRLCRQRCGLK